MAAPARAENKRIAHFLVRVSGLGPRHPSDGAIGVNGRGSLAVDLGGHALKPLAWRSIPRPAGGLAYRSFPPLIKRASEGGVFGRPADESVSHRAERTRG